MEVFGEFVEVFYIFVDILCICGKVFFLNLWRFAYICGGFCVFVEVLHIFTNVYCELVKFSGVFVYYGYFVCHCEDF